MKQSLTKTTAHWLEKELIVLLAIVVILGGLVGYSLAASHTTSSMQLPSTMKATLVGGDEVD